MSEQKEITKAYYGVISGVMASVLSLVYWFFALNLRPDSSFGVNSLGNIKCYVAFVCIFLLGFSICYEIIRICGIKVISNIYLKSAVGVGLFVLICVSVTPFFEDTWIFSPVITVICVGGGLVIYLKNIRKEKIDESKFNFVVLILIGGMFWGIAVATPNTFSPAVVNSQYDVHHTSAYIDSIYNVYKHIQFHGGITDQYGHYGLFFYLPLKIFGFSTKTIAGLCGVLSGFTYIFAMISFCRIVKSHILRYLIIVVGGSYAIYPALSCIYWQIFPHRILFPAITLFLVTEFMKNKVTIWRKCIAILIMAFAVLWNFETGIVCCLAWAAFRGIDVLQNEKDLIKCIKGVTERIISVIMIPILASFGVVNLYNLFCGGIGALLGIKEFMGMAIDESYIKFLCTPIEWGNMIYLHRVMVFMFVLCWGMLYNPLFGIKGLEKKAGYAVVNGIIGLGLMTYYMNRTLAGDNLVNLFFVICLGLILDGITRISKIRDARTAHIYNVIKYMTGVYAFLVLFGCGLQAIEVYQGYVDKYNGRAYSYDEFEEFAQEVSQTVPQNTWAMGEGTSALYMELGWEKGTWGFGDIQADEMPEQDGLFVCNARYEHVPDSFELVHEFGYYDIIFGYFTKKAE